MTNTLFLGFLIISCSCVIAWEAWKVAQLDFKRITFAKRFKPGFEKGAASYFSKVGFAMSATLLAQLLLFVNPSLRNVLCVPILLCALAIYIGIRRFCDRGN